MKIYVSFLMTALVFVQCSTFDSLKKKRVEYENYHTYNWSSRRVETNELVRFPMLNRQVKNSVDQVLQEKGFQLSETDSVDFYVLTYGNMRDKKQATDVSRYQTGETNPAISSSNVMSYEEGTLIIEIIDSKSNEMVWRNYGVGIVGEAETPEKLDSAMDETVAQILNGFPPQ